MDNISKLNSCISKTILLCKTTNIFSFETTASEYLLYLYTFDIHLSRL